ncbi:MAG: SDR family oxidoreductase [Gemmatimonadales bacterium]|nr:SDR family oxidoreductase [Gemmatimonadales bacterium]NIN10076.1 SDR family oxidoreductase [Gemmatimonadales bacterium]NIQ98727.1 SDR family oxidoreductase [Gemmatimonadales bacterium]NIS63605.1 SDR family oxidoreductase [Gemmatimonadales bacterium]
MDLQLDGRVALIGGSSSGLGLAIATTLAAEGCHVALNGRDADRLARAVEHVKAHAHREVVAVQADVSVPAQVEELARRVTQQLGPVDILLCNAGGPPAMRFDAVPAEGWDAALGLNLLSTIHLCGAVLPSMRERHWGRIICLTSVAAKQPITNLILSTTARAGVLGFAKTLADEVAVDGITVNCVCPGYMRTERVEELAAELAAQRNRRVEDVLGDFVRGIPTGRMGEPAELAAVVAFLASEQASYITGVALQVDGGLVRSIL